MTKHLRALASAKPAIKRLELNTEFIKALEQRETQVDPAVKFAKEQAQSSIFREQREVAKKVQTAKAVQNY